jgi:hypothetical protein
MSAPPSPSQSNTTPSQQDVNNDGSLDNVTTVVNQYDIDNDSQTDFTETTSTAVDAQGEVIQVTAEVDAPETIVNMTATGSVEIDDSADSAARAALMNAIEGFKNNISCDKVQHLGSLEDYRALLVQAQELMQNNEDSITLALNNEAYGSLTAFADQAQVYSDLVEQISVQFNAVTVVNDIPALTNIKNQLEKISNMYDNIHKFHAIIEETAVLKVPSSIQAVAGKLENVLDSLECSMPFLEHFVGTGAALSAENQALADLSPKDKAAIAKAEAALAAWYQLVSNQANVFSTNDPYVSALNTKLSAFQDYATRMSAALAAFQQRMASWGANPPDLQ